MKQLFAFSGTHCVGKTTLIQKLASDYTLCINNESPKIIESHSSNINTYMNILGKDTIQMEILRREYKFLLENVNSYNHIILKDRCILDVLAYTLFSYENNDINIHVYEIVKDSVNYLLSQYKKIFVLPIVSNLNYNFSRDKFAYSSKSRDEINNIFLSLYDEYKSLYNNLYKLEAQTYNEMFEEVKQVIKTL